MKRNNISPLVILIKRMRALGALNDTVRMRVRVSFGLKCLFSFEEWVDDIELIHYSILKKVLYENLKLKQ